MDMDKLNEVYDEVLGIGPALEDTEDAGAPPTGSKDGAYSQEDYGDDAEDGTDPRDTSTLEESEDGDLLGTEEPFENEEVDDEEYEDVPERLVEAGRTANLSERDIVELAESHPEALEALARAQEQTIASPAPPQQQSAKQEPAQRAPAGSFEPMSLDFTDDDRDEMGERSINIINTLVDKVNTLGAKVAEQSDVTTGIQHNSEQEKIRNIDATFDELAGDIPALGETESLTKDQIANRKFAFGSAREAMRAYGNLTIKQALTIGANSLRGQDTDTQVKTKIISDLNKNKKRFINRGRGQRKAKQSKSVEDRALEAINTVLDDPKYG